MAQDAQLISQAEQISAVSDETLFSVAEGAGKPQKNVKYSDLESKLMTDTKSRVTSLETSVGNINTTNEQQNTRISALETAVKPGVASLAATFTLEQSSNPAFDVVNRAAADLYLSQVGGYLFFNSSDGKTYAAKLNPADWTKLADGTPVTADIEAKTETMVHFPDCHFKAEGKTMKFGGIIPIEGGKVFGAPHWVGAYLGYVGSDGALHSRPNVAPSHSKTMSAFWDCAQKLGKDYGLDNYQHDQLMNAVFEAKYGNLDSQAVIGAGFQHEQWEAARDVPMGLTRSLGDGSGKVLYNDATLGDQYPVKLFGLEDRWSKLWEFRPGIRFEMRDGVRYAIVYDGNQVSNTAEGREFVTAVQSSEGAFVKSMKLGEYWDVIPESISGASAATYYCDSYWANTAGQLLDVGGRSAFFSRCGLSCAASGNGFSYSHATVGSRLAFWSEPVIIGGSELVAILS